MELNSFKQRLERLKVEKPNFEFTINSGASQASFEKVETKTGQVIPNKIRSFWTYYNGLETVNPALKIHPINEWEISNELIHFASFNDTNKIYFKIDQLNQAKEWSIINKKENYILTLTMSSFWSNKVWHWLEHERSIWKDEYWKF